MTAVEPFDAADPMGDGRTVIEASAGTGKTFTIAATVARLVAIEGLDLDRVLVVTFTRAATAELKGRVRSRMVMSLRSLEGRPPPDETDSHLQVLFDLCPDEKRRAVERLRRALTDFDRAQIFTIHGFARRLLGQLGFRVRLPETLEPGEVDDLLLSQVAGDLVVDRFAHNPSGEEVLTPGLAARIGGELIDHPDARVVPEPSAVTGVARARVEMAQAVAEETERRMRAAGTITFDGGLVEVGDALADPEIGAAAGDLLRRRYDIGLVDESQDTDPTQWQIIRSIFDESRLVVIGDPKQSIYSFRGADIESYLSAREGASGVRTLVTNWRSDGPLVAALDVLFAGATFGDERIAYRSVEAADAHRASRIKGVGPALRIRSVSSDLPIDCRRDGYYRVDAAREAVAADTAAEVVRLLSSGVTIAGPLGHRPLKPDDISVLCRTKKQVDLVRGQLGDRQVPSVSARTGGVLVTPAAEEWRRFLLGVERPDRLDLVRLAATTCLVGHTLAEVAALDDDAALALQRQMRDWQETLHGVGVPALVADLNRHTGLAARMLALPEGERVMTDLTHIAEEMHTVWRRGRHGSLAAWLETTMTEAASRESRGAEEPESRQRRLETDADAVTVQTIHGAKGLEYPVVLVPYAWDVSLWEPDFPVFHEPEPSPGDQPRRRLINVAGQGSPGFDDHCVLAMSEDEAEESRLLYVALTRARHHLVVWWVENHVRIDEAKLTSLLTHDGRGPETLAASSGGTIGLSVMAELPGTGAWRPPPRGRTLLERARFDRQTDHLWRRASFSSLSGDHPLAVADEKAEHPLRADEGEALEDAAPPLAAATLPLADMPRGARFGTLVHDILERLRWDEPDLPAAVGVLLDAEMRTAAWNFDPSVFGAGVVAAMDTPLGPEPEAMSLRSLAGACMRELAFELPVCTRRGSVSLADIGRVMADHLRTDDPYRRYVGELVGLPPQPFRGYLAGAIDLVAVLPGDRYVVMDYKSNSLPMLGDAPGPADYGPAALAAEMVSHRYVLQTTLYQVALHRYLQWRLPDYDPLTHLGGSTYLFIRGMIGPDTPVIDGERCGVARWRPPAAMVVALSRLLAEAGDG